LAIDKIAKIYLEKYPNTLNNFQQKVLTDIINCKTEVMGGHILKCPDCGKTKASYNSCGNRNCPKCGGFKRDKWAYLRKSEALPTEYFHVVFTVPAELNALFLQNPKSMYNALLKCAWNTISDFGNDYKYLGAQMGMIAIVHTWGQNLSVHPHIHCLIPGGGIDKNRKWRNLKKSNGKFLFSVKALSKVFSAKMLKETSSLLKKSKVNLPEDINKQNEWIRKLYHKKWVVYAKRTIKNPRSIVEYLAKYTHKTAITDRRIKYFDNEKVVFSYFDYRDSKAKETCLTVFEFIRRFSQHILPLGFVKIRHYGILGNRRKKQTISLLKGVAIVNEKKEEKLVWQDIYIAIYGQEPYLCDCKKAVMKIVSEIPRNKGRPNYKEGFDKIKIW
jgi:hypothetical protein